ncbi:MAG: DUF4337 family protein [Verrucomicrobiae bacterium]
MEAVQEQIGHHAARSPEKWNSWVAVTTAVLAALAAITSLLAGHHANEAMLNQIQSASQWSFFQAKGIKSEAVKTRMEIGKMLGQPVGSKDEEQKDRYAEEQKEIRKVAEEKQELAEFHLRHHVILARGVTMFQIAIAISAIAILTKRRSFWILSMVLGVIGSGSLLHGLLGR